MIYIDSDAAALFAKFLFFSAVLVHVTMTLCSSVEERRRKLFHLSLRVKLFC